MTIIDAQVHIWKAETPDRPHIREDASIPHRPIPLTCDSLHEEMNTAGVDRVILVPPSWEGYRNDYALEAARKYPDRFAVMGKVPLNDPASKDKLATWLKQPGMFGFRISFRHSGTHSILDDGTADWRMVPLPVLKWLWGSALGSSLSIDLFFNNRAFAR